MKTKEEILTAIRACAKKLGRNPKMFELWQMSGISESQLYRRLGNLRKAFTLAGLEFAGSGLLVGASALLLDWAKVARTLNKLPTVEQYAKQGCYGTRTFIIRFERWANIAQAFQKYVALEKMEKQWADVLNIITAKEERRAVKSRDKKSKRTPLLMDRPVYGDPLMMPEMAHEPTNEAGVVFAFGVLARRLGFVVLRMQTIFPDCEAMRRMAKGQWQRVRIEFEFESRNFVKHGHRKDGCDVIVCWTHNWVGCPATIEVVELKGVVGEVVRR